MLGRVLMELYLDAVYGKTDEEWAYNLRFSIHEKFFGCKHVYSPQGDHDASLCCSLASPYINQLKGCLPEVVNRSTGTSNYLVIMTEFIANLREFNCILDSNADIMECNADYQHNGILSGVVDTLEYRNSYGTQSNGWRGKLIDLLDGEEIKRQNTQTPQPNDAS